MISCWAGSAAANRPELLVPSLLLRLCQLALAPLLYLCAFTAHAQGSVARPRIESFFGHQPFSNPVLSPDGKLLAVIVGMAGKRDSLAVIELATDRVYPTAHFVDADIGQARWVNNERLVFPAKINRWGRATTCMAPACTPSMSTAANSGSWRAATLRAWWTRPASTAPGPAVAHLYPVPGRRAKFRFHLCVELRLSRR